MSSFLSKIDPNGLLYKGAIHFQAFSLCQLDVMCTLLNLFDPNNPSKTQYVFSPESIEKLTNRRWSIPELKCAIQEIGCRMLVEETDIYVRKIFPFGGFKLEFDTNEFTLYINPMILPKFKTLKEHFKASSDLENVMYIQSSTVNKKSRLRG